MAMKLEFKFLRNNSIFHEGFEDLISTDRQTIEFKKQPQASGGIAVLYAPNGTGKSTFTHTVGTEESTDEVSFEARYNNTAWFGPEDKKFHIIEDQINRNIIPGETSDYLIGQDIRREYRLKKQIAYGFRTAFDELVASFKGEYGVSKVTDFLLAEIQRRNQTAYTYIRSIVNKSSRGKDINQGEFVTFIRNPENTPNVAETEVEKRAFIKSNQSLIKELLAVNVQQIVTNTEIEAIEQNDDAIKMLSKYSYLHSCVVCDNENYDGEQILARKRENRRRVYESLDTKTKKILDKIVMDKALIGSDPFNIKNIVLGFIKNGDAVAFEEVCHEIESYIDDIVNRMIVTLINIFDGTSMYAWYDEYTTLLQSQPELDSEELLFIEQVISENISRDIRVIRDEENDRNFKLMLGEKPLLGTERSEMQLSTGEQNFISLTFALLLARHSNKEFVVLDDPISSFDSVYKNKIAFCIVKFLERKKQIVLTHNTDLIRLLEVQLKDCFNLYILGNSEGGYNGFIPVKREEKQILISLYELIKLLQNKDGVLGSIVVDKRLFLMSMIPFMRGYAHITNDIDDNYTRLSVLMHGFEHTTVDVGKVYKTLFGFDFGEESISVEDVLNQDCSSLNIIDSNEYPLLADTLNQTLIYYHVRMKVEHDLIDIFDLPVVPGNIMLLTDIIRRAFTSPVGATQEEKDELRNNRVFFTSRKTLLNEFNHFEGNMNIFQPAIDIEPLSLQREVTAIDEKLAELRSRYQGVE